MKKIISGLLILAMLLALTACGAEESVPTEEADVPTEDSPAPMESVSVDTEWTICWYLCRSDLESEFGAATNDLVEMMEVQLPETVKVVIQTGGSAVWQTMRSARRRWGAMSMTITGCSA